MDLGTPLSQTVATTAAVSTATTVGTVSLETDESRSPGGPLISVIVPTRDRAQTLQATIDAVRRGTFDRFEMIIVDQSAGHETRDLVALVRDDRLRYLSNRREGYGAASSRNLGIAVSRAPLLAMTDDDTEPASDWLERIVTLFHEDDELEFIAGALVAPPHDSASGFVPSFDAEPGISMRELALRAAGANLAARARLLYRIGGFDEYCGPGSRLRASDDGDLLLRVVASGCKVRVDPGVRVLHTNGFRPSGEAMALHERYSFGNGGNYGRIARRGKGRLGLWFVGRELAKLVRGLMPGRDFTNEAGFVRLRLKGFIAGFTLDPADGFVSGEALQRMAEAVHNASRESGRP